QAIYNLGDYPARVYPDVTDYDRELIKRMSDMGVTLIQLHEEWNDNCRLYGADKFSSSDPAGTRNFVDLCHSFGIKVIPYVSSGYMDERDPDFREEFSPNKDDRLKSLYYNYRKCDLGHPGWRDYIIEKTKKVMDDYGFDGIYNDWGYSNFDRSLGMCVIPEGAYDPELEDALGEIYSEIKRRGGVYKLHCDRNNAPPCKDRVYDYLWIGEGVADSVPGKGKEYLPYMVPCVDANFNKEMTHEMYYAYTIPFLQFPLMKTGRAIRGENLNLPGVTYFGGSEEKFYSEVREWNLKNPNGPYVHSLWSSIPEDVNEAAAWEKYAKLYKPMVTENSVVYMELFECTDIISKLGDGIVASMFVNEEKYLVVSNLTDKPYELVLKGKWKNRETGEISSRFVIGSKKMLMLVAENG
ncbi:MAG: hypothetical protein IJF32_04895, partial [Oscillospiraceae bacterium]|nr:hypothetical protein [Oscillospiraceae bacterium]